MPLQATSGAASYDAFGGGVPVVPNYIEDVFSTYLYTGTGAAQTITNGIDLSTKGGLVWCKSRSSSISHGLSDTVTGRTKALRTNNFANQVTTNDSITSFNSNGFSLGTDLDTGWFNTNLANYVSWTFREQPKFFDVVTWTGSGSNRTIAHSLGSVPACIIVKRRDDDANWQVYHRSLANTEYMVLNTTDAKATGATRWNSTTPTSTVFSIGTDATVNASGGTYVAYVFAHDAGGFGLTGTDNVISCGSFTTSSGVATVNLGYEPQWILYRLSSAQDNWWISDNMRGMSMTQNNGLFADRSDAESDQYPYGVTPTSTGFTYNIGSGTHTGIYIAIRRGPMKVPTSGTSVFNIVSRTGTGATATVTGVGFPVDLVFAKNQSNATFYWDWIDRLRGPDRNLFSNATDAEYSNATVAYQSLTSFANMDGVVLGADGWNAYINGASNPYTNYFWRRAPSFFDEVCYTGDGANNRTVTTNLGVAAELIIFKCRGTAGVNGFVAIPSISSGYLVLDATTSIADVGTNYFASSSTNISFPVSASQNTNTRTYVAYLFATCAGVSKVFSYTGNGSSQTINCGFTSGARFVLIKRTDSTGDWYVWDSARGIVSGNDPHLSLNTTAAEVTTDDSVDTDNTGFIVNQLSATDVNVTSATYIGIAIA